MRDARTEIYRLEDGSFEFHSIVGFGAVPDGQDEKVFLQNCLTTFHNCMAPNNGQEKAAARIAGKELVEL